MNISQQEILSHDQIKRKIHRMSLEIKEKTFGYKDIIRLVGLSQNGFIMAKTMASILKNMNTSVHEINFEKGFQNINCTPTFENAGIIIIISDVLNSGKNVAYLLSYFLQIPHEKIMNVVLIDRYHRTYPIRSDIRGMELSTSLNSHINVDLSCDTNFKAYLS